MGYGMSNGLIRDPDDWARDHGWVSRLRAVRAANRLRHIANVIDSTLGDEAEVVEWGKALREVARYLAPVDTPAERKRARREKGVKS
jgi:hypothetical protein